MATLAPTREALAALPARGLLSLIKSACAEPGFPNAQDILRAFYSRYAPYLTRVVANHLGPLPDTSGIEVVVHDAFLAFWKTASSFEIDRTGTDEECDRNVRTYLAQRARWKAANARPFLQTIGRDSREVLPEIPERASTEEQPSQFSPAHRRIAEWLAQLPERERDVIHAYYLDDHPGHAADRLPAPVVQGLCRKYSITPSALRHLKRRLLQQLHQQLSTNAFPEKAKKSPR